MDEILCGKTIEEKERENNPIFDEFRGLYDMAEERLAVCTTPKEQVIALETAGGAVLCRKITVLSDEEDALLRDIGESVVVRMVCMWGNGGVDVPSYRFRQTLCEKAEGNRNAEILLMSTAGVAKKALWQFEPGVPRRNRRGGARDS